ncbi:MAG: hypothetical protein WBB68_05215, partial [Candidatus Moraniibacteriota bacterium]
MIRGTPPGEAVVRHAVGIEEKSPGVVESDIDTDEGMPDPVPAFKIKFCPVAGMLPAMKRMAAMCPVSIVN